MSRKAAKTIMLTTKCSSGCMHCPFIQDELTENMLHSFRVGLSE